MLHIVRKCLSVAVGCVTLTLTQDNDGLSSKDTGNCRRNMLALRHCLVTSCNWAQCGATFTVWGNFLD